MFGGVGLAGAGRGDEVSDVLRAGHEGVEEAEAGGLGEGVEAFGNEGEGGIAEGFGGSW